MFTMVTKQTSAQRRASRLASARPQRIAKISPGRLKALQRKAKQKKLTKQEQQLLFQVQEGTRRRLEAKAAEDARFYHIGSRKLLKTEYTAIKDAKGNIKEIKAKPVRFLKRRERVKGPDELFYDTFTPEVLTFDAKGNLTSREVKSIHVTDRDNTQILRRPYTTSLETFSANETTRKTFKSIEGRARLERVETIQGGFRRVSKGLSREALERSRQRERAEREGRTLQEQQLIETGTLTQQQLTKAKALTPEAQQREFGFVLDQNLPELTQQQRARATSLTESAQIKQFGRVVTQRRSKQSFKPSPVFGDFLGEQQQARFIKKGEEDIEVFKTPTFIEGRGPAPSDPRFPVIKNLKLNIEEVGGLKEFGKDIGGHILGTGKGALKGLKEVLSPPTKRTIKDGLVEIQFDPQETFREKFKRDENVRLVTGVGAFATVSAIAPPLAPVLLSGLTTYQTIKTINEPTAENIAAESLLLTSIIAPKVFKKLPFAKEKIQFQVFKQGGKTNIDVLLRGKTPSATKGNILGTNIRILKLPVKQDVTVSTFGLELSGRSFPLVTKTPKGIKLGKFNLASPLALGSLAEPIAAPVTAVGTEALASTFDLKPTEITRIKAFQDLIRSGKGEVGLEVPEVIFKLDALKDPVKASKIIDKILAKKGGVIFGTATTQQLPRGFQTKIGDIDVVFPDKREAQVADVIKMLEIELKGIGEGLEVSPKNPLVLQSQLGTKILEAKAGVDPTELSGPELANVGGLGFLFGNLRRGEVGTIRPFGRGKSITIGEQFQRKITASAFFRPATKAPENPDVLKGEGILPLGRRFKDLPGAILTGRGISALKGGKLDKDLAKLMSTFTEEQKFVIEEAIKGQKQTEFEFIAKPSPKPSPKKSPSPLVSIKSPLISPRPSPRSPKSPFLSSSMLLSGSPSPKLSSRSLLSGSPKSPSPKSPKVKSPSSIFKSPSPSPSPISLKSPSPKSPRSPSPVPIIKIEEILSPKKPLFAPRPRKDIRKKKRKKKLKRPTKFTPSLTSKGLLTGGKDIIEKAVPKRLTGLEIRPIVRRNKKRRR